MALSDPLNPYADNILVDRLGNIPTREDAVKALMYRPEPPQSMEGVPKHIRAHQLMDVRDLHMPPVEEFRLLETTDLMIRQSYRYRDPRQASTWSALSGEAERRNILLPQAQAAAVEGISGVGKTQACLRCLRTFPQLIHHESFPYLQSGLTQVTWLSIDVPASGRADDLARALMMAWQEATGSHRFDHWLAKDKMTSGIRALDEWLQVAATNFLGVLHADEVQNFFRLSGLKQRKNRKGFAGAPELSIVEDQTLRWFLNLVNRGRFAVLFSGTPDGIGALTKRLSTMSRVTTGGYHAFEPFVEPDASEFRSIFLQQLGRYQYVRHPLTIDDNFARLIIDLTGGVQRIIIALWVAAHRVAFERKTDDLRMSDFTTAAKTWLAPLSPAIEALRSKDPVKLARYEDLTPRDTAFWSNFWRSNIPS